MTADYDKLLTTWAECRDLLSKERKASEDLRESIRAYFRHLEKSVNVGPLTNNPTKESALLRRMRELVSAPSSPLTSPQGN